MLSYLFVLLINLGIGTNQDSCLQNFRDAFSNLKNAQKNTKGILIDYSVEVVGSEGDRQIEHLSLRSVGGKTLIKSGSVSVFQDQSNMVAFQPEEKTVFITKAIPAEWKRAQLSGILQQQDSLMEYVSLKNCSWDVLEGKKFQKLVFEVKEPLRDAGVKAVSYWLDNTSIKSISIEYNESIVISSWKMVIDRLEMNYSQDPFHGSALSQALDKSNKLKTNFQGFTLIDQRN